ncbi:hypothetical protein K2173_024133 [Erythroxylum novogranatense]|uniref:J domain-containing protein n=1 Tax=Erythroxylum novogranatense TaxID=1862640 RepID=A0AAV8UC14_9ROSI|nr:hypothetical protein K2173_024133 [Erythroxylum novogranatense]
MMRAKLWRPLSALLQRMTFTSTGHRLRIHHTAISCPSTKLRNHFLGKTFCSQFSREVTAQCWNCGAKPQQGSIPFLACSCCRAVQPIDPSVDFFHIFGLEKDYELGDVNLEGKYKDWQKKLHPDLVHSKSQQERDFAAEQSARLIDAYRTLGNPLSRAIYMLRLEGIDVNEEETISEPGLLAEIMEVREAVEEAPDSKTLNEIQSQMQEKLQEWSNSFANAFQTKKFDLALTCIRRMKYYDRVIEETRKRL